MVKKSTKKTLKIVGVLIVVAFILFFSFEYYTYENSLTIQQEAFSLISKGDYVGGLTKCLEKPYEVTPCYAFVFANMLAKNQTVTQEFCKSIPLADKLPFWKLKATQDAYHEKIKQLKTQCYQVFFTKGLGITDPQEAQAYADKNINNK